MAAAIWIASLLVNVRTSICGISRSMVQDAGERTEIVRCVRWGSPTIVRRRLDVKKALVQSQMLNRHSVELDARSIADNAFARSSVSGSGTGSVT